PRCSTTRSRTGTTKASSAARTEPGRTARPPRLRERNALADSSASFGTRGLLCTGTGLAAAGPGGITVLPGQVTDVPSPGGQEVACARYPPMATTTHALHVCGSHYPASFPWSQGW